jgi:NAD+ synthase (glutamine-hydrolysing)
MIVSYIIAQLTPKCQGKKGFLLVLCSGNADEYLRGYVTKYDCSSGDINPLGTLNKNDVKDLLMHF